MKLPVWKPHQTKIAEKEMASLVKVQLEGSMDEIERKQDAHVSCHEAERCQRGGRLSRVDISHKMIPE
jgi:hypothetical protein